MGQEIGKNSKQEMEIEIYGLEMGDKEGRRKS